MYIINLHLRIQPMLDFICDHIPQSGEYVDTKSSQSLEDVKCKVNGLRYTSEDEFWEDISKIYVGNSVDAEDEPKVRFNEIKNKVREAVSSGVPLPMDFGRPTGCDSLSNPKTKSKNPVKKRIKLSMENLKVKGARTKRNASPTVPHVKDETEPGYSILSDLFNSTFENSINIAMRMKGLGIANVRGNAKLDGEVARVLSILHKEGMHEGCVISGAPSTVNIEKYLGEKSNGKMPRRTSRAGRTGARSSPPVGPGGIGKSKGKRYNNKLKYSSNVSSITIKPAVTKHEPSWGDSLQSDFIGASYGALSPTSIGESRRIGADLSSQIPSPLQLQAGIASFSSATSRSTNSFTGLEYNTSRNTSAWGTIRPEDGAGERSSSMFARAPFEGVISLDKRNLAQSSTGAERPRVEPYEASLRLFGRNIVLGTFRTARLAAEAHDRAYLRAMGTQGVISSDKNRKGALRNDKMSEGSAQLNFHVSSYASDSTELFKMHDEQLNKCLWGTPWKGLQHPDFAFIADMHDSDSQDGSSQNYAIGGESEYITKAAQARSISQKSGKNRRSHAKNDDSGRGTSVRSTLKGLRALFQDEHVADASNANTGTSAAQEELPRDATWAEWASREEAPSGHDDCHMDIFSEEELNVGAVVKLEARSKASHDGFYDPALLSNGGGSTTTTTTSATSDSAVELDCAPKTKHFFGSRGRGLGDESPVSTVAALPATSLCLLVKYDLPSFIPVRVLAPVLARLEAASTSNSPGSSSISSGISSSNNGFVHSNSESIRNSTSSQTHSFACYDSSRGVHQCKDIQPEICRILAYEVIAAKDINFSRKERSVQFVQELEKVSWDLYFDKDAFALLRGTGAGAERGDSRSMRATLREKEKDGVKGRIVNDNCVIGMGYSSGDGSISASASSNSLPSEEAVSTTLSFDGEVLKAMECNAYEWERCLVSKKASKNALSALRDQIRNTVKKLESKSLGTKSYSGVKQICREVPLFVFELPGHLVDASSAPLKSCQTYCNDNGDSENKCLPQRGFFGSALEAALIREQILDSTDSARMQGPCSTNFSTKEWSMLVGLGNQISAFLKVYQVNL